MPALDTIFQGRVGVWQPTKEEGYRFNVDSLLLAAFALRYTDDSASVLELGSGSSVIGLAMLHHRPYASYLGLERQEPLASLARRSIEEAGLGNRATVKTGDLRDNGIDSAAYDVVVFNPPYFPAGRGRSSQIVGRREAREALHGDIDDFLRAASHALKPGGFVFAVVRPERRSEVFKHCGSQHLRIVEICEVLTCREGKHQLDLMLIRRGGPNIEQPSVSELVLHIEKGSRTYTDAVNAFLSGEADSLTPDAFCTKT